MTRAGGAETRNPKPEIRLKLETRKETGLMTDPDARSAKAFDLEERTARFGARVIAFADRVRKTAITQPLVTQLIK